MQSSSKVEQKGQASDDERERIEIELLLEGMFRLYGYDFRHYSYPSLRRRIWNRIYGERLNSVSELQAKVLHDPSSMKRLVSELVIHVTEMFRDPHMFAYFRKHVVPVLRNLPSIRIWHAGCSTGEEVYSMAILLHEEGLYERTTLYATDMSEDVLQIAGQATYPLNKMKEYTKNYILAEGKDEFSKYYSTSENAAAFHPLLHNNIVFAQHNLVTDRSFNEFHVILCRNVMIYFDAELQARVHELIYDSLCQSGFLVLGDKETITFTKYAGCYELLTSEEKLYCKKS
ncbi:protein-glutamate O-methyltransferase CheR [Paenibacillus sp. S3N08]|uniref:Protein-glutamate O-methyltransferase CheR n=2 Tax=Paenibacillus agricola TaxID=2716264 RepID=A0ABX0J7I8_9BACL|nr:protein-glutamate O-methyltransferase CheR [Paenibacillus agricola]